MQAPARKPGTVPKRFVEGVCTRIDSNKERVYSLAQLAQQQAFREAAAYGKAKQAEQIYIFLADTHALEGALVRAGDARPDWEQFALHIEGKFEPDVMTVLLIIQARSHLDPKVESMLTHGQ